VFVSRSSDRLSEALGSSDTQTKDPVRLAAYVAFCLILGVWVLPCEFRHFPLLKHVM